ncbi:uncharacterized protein LOC110193308 isoform X2 [Phascolarctos cinereus]|uniref:Zinc finger protein with KRAB and SCAN domains 2-like isoform X2 n=1 Tax=Phascolarctos cinereus TaxID=38626 RepID=A0A6P5IPV1_PHACI|nr:zinc finger protein with KRAB and SCAN domains 2-like isoform X2 [Phascolarctos cinereus]
MEGSSSQGDLKPKNVLKKPRKGSWRASWGQHEIKLLLEAIFKTGKVHQIISGNSQRKSKLWREVTETLAKRHVGYTAEQCRTKWKHLKTQFRFEQARYLTTGAHSDPLPHFYEEMSNLWKMAARCSPKAGPSKWPKQPTKAKTALQLQRQNKEEEVLPGTWSQPPQAVTPITEHQSNDSETSDAPKEVDGCAANQAALGRETLEEPAFQQEKPEVPCDPRYQQIGETMLEELRNLSRTQQEMSVVSMYIAKALQYQQEQLIPGIHLLNHNMYQLCLLLANQTEASLHSGPFLPEMINPSIVFSGSPVPQPYPSDFEPSGGAHPK